MSSRRRWWTIYFACSAVVLMALVWITVVVLRLETAKSRARAETAQQETLRLALWRMDSWLTSRLATEAVRPYFEYQAFYPQRRGYTRLLNPIEPGDVLTPSPLLSFRSDYFPLHFQLAESGELTSPQYPEGELRRLAAGSFLSASTMNENAARFNLVTRLLRRKDLEACVAESELELRAVKPEVDAVIAELVPEPARSANMQLQQSLSQKEWTKRKGAFLENVLRAQQSASPGIEDGTGSGDVSVGPLVPLWISDGESPADAALIFIRRVRIDRSEVYQGFLCDWDRLRGALLDEISDLITQARLIPVPASGLDSGPDPDPDPADAGTMLAAIPVALEIPLGISSQTLGSNPSRSTLSLTWLAVLTALAATAITLRSSIAFGEKRSRFASAVTHELRTPLTTFQMYTEMLADGIVEDPEKRQSYLQTLKEESVRLSALVENVLSYARLEEGRWTSHREDVRVDRLLSKLVPALERRAEDAGTRLEIQNRVPEGTSLDTDVDAIGQILFNLVDNACKYGQGAGDPTIRLEVTRDDGRLHLIVQDSGPGITEEQARHIFAPFERGAYNDGSKPGIGLGLALSRGLAKDLGGELALRPSGERGARFDLSLPMRG